MLFVEEETHLCSRGEDETKGVDPQPSVHLRGDTPINRFWCTNKFIRNRLRAKVPGLSIRGCQPTDFVQGALAGGPSECI